MNVVGETREKQVQFLHNINKKNVKIDS